jgi:hypothetical protein
MNKRIIGTAMLLGIGVVYCIRLLTGRANPPKMKASPKIEN